MSFFIEPRGQGAYDLLAENLGQGLGQGIQTGLNARLQDMLAKQQINRREREYIQRGVPPQLASLAAAATVGGQTEAFKYLIDQIKRGESPEQSFSSQEMRRSPEISIGTKETNSVPQIQKDLDQGLTPSERVRRQESRYKTQTKQYEEAQDRSNDFSQEGIKIERLESLNNSDKLPQGLGRVNVNLKNGELRFPFASNPETQEFIKVMNDFLVGAKGTFGARVTNFEVDRFLRRLPSLLNTKEGREAVLHQMRIINEINQLQTQGIVDAFDEAGGVRRLDYDEAARRSHKKNREQLNALKKLYVTGEKELDSLSKDTAKGFDSLPPANQYAGKKARDTKTGEVFQSDGVNWKRVQ